jgi:hypothetical protein
MVVAEFGHRGDQEPGVRKELIEKKRLHSGTRFAIRIAGRPKWFSQRVSVGAGNGLRLHLEL